MKPPIDGSRFQHLLDLPYPRPSKRKRMDIENRAAQFAPFAALTGYEAAVAEGGRRTDRRIERSEEQEHLLDRQLSFLRTHLSERPELTVTYFRADLFKEGGSYERLTGRVRKIDDFERVLIFTDGTTLPIDDIFQMQGEVFQSNMHE